MSLAPRLRTTPFTAALLALALAAAGTAQETGAVTGAVVDLQTGEPIAGVKLTIDGTRLKGETGADGRYRIEGVPAGEQVMRLHADGYVAVIEKLEIDAGWTTGADVAMPRLFAMLEALVVEAGLGREPGDSALRSGLLREADRDADPFASLSRVPGVHVSWSGGVVGRGARIRIRGMASQTLSNDPTIYVDGVRVMPETPVYDTRGAEASRYYNLDFVDPTNIDRIEVLRGPATAFRYGLNASAGVILIFTKRGGGV